MALFGGRTMISRGDTRYELSVVFPELPLEDPLAPEYDAGQYADNGMPDYFELTRSGDNLILSIKEDTAPFDGQDLVTRATITLPIADVSQLKIKGSTDQDFFVISDLGDFAGLVSVVGVETDGLVDSVQIYDTAGDDVWTAAEDYGVFQMQNAYTVTATDVTVMHGYASAGGNDRAYLYGNERTNKVKTFDNDTNLVRLYLGGVYHRAKFFDSVEIDGLGGVDTAILYGTPSDDLFTATKDEGSFTSPHGGGIDYSYKGFELVTARGGSGRDRAELSDSELADEVRLRPSKAWMSERGTSTPAYAITLRGFESIHATALTDDGKVDIIKMHDSDAVPNPPVTNDLLTATMEDGRVRAKFYSNPANPLAPSAADQIYESLGFELTKGYSAAGSDKRATSGVDAEPAGLGRSLGRDLRRHGHHWGIQQPETVPVWAPGFDWRAPVYILAAAEESAMTRNAPRLPVARHRRPHADRRGVEPRFPLEPRPRGARRPLARRSRPRRSLPILASSSRRPVRSVPSGAPALWRARRSGPPAERVGGP